MAKGMSLSISGLISHFGTKECLQLAVLQSAATMFANRVTRPARNAQPGEDRLRAYFDNWIKWSRAPELPGGCLFIAASIELDDRAGICRYFLVKVQKEWTDALQGAALEARTNGQFREALDPGQIAFGMTGIMHSIHLYERLFRDRAAEPRGRAAFESLTSRAWRLVVDDTIDQVEDDTPNQA